MATPLDLPSREETASPFEGTCPDRNSSGGPRGMTDSQDETTHPVLSERTNIIVMADEAHRTQYGFNDGGYAQNLRRALPNASFLGFTGTPVDSKDADTELVFGKTIHTYDIKQAVEDGATVPIYYESRLAKLALKEPLLPQVDAQVDERCGGLGRGCGAKHCG